MITWFDGDFSIVEVATALCFLAASLLAMFRCTGFLPIAIPFFCFLEEISYGLIFVPRGRFFNFGRERIDSLHDFLAVAYHFRPELLYGFIALSLFIAYKLRSRKIMHVFKDRNFIYAVLCLFMAQLIDIILMEGTWVYASEETLELMASVFMLLWVKRAKRVTRSR